MTSHFLPLVFPVTRPEARSHQRSGCDQVFSQRRCVWSTRFKVFCCQHWLDGRSHRNTDYQLLLCPPLCACEVKGRALSRGPQGRFSVGKASCLTDAEGNEVATGGGGVTLQTPPSASACHTVGQLPRQKRTVRQRWTQQAQSQGLPGGRWVSSGRLSGLPGAPRRSPRVRVSGSRMGPAPLQHGLL